MIGKWKDDSDVLNDPIIIEKVDELEKKYGLHWALIQDLILAFAHKDVNINWESIEIICGEIKYAVNKELYSELKKTSSDTINPNEELGILGGMNY